MNFKTKKVDRSRDHVGRGLGGSSGGARGSVLRPATLEGYRRILEPAPVARSACCVPGGGTLGSSQLRIPPARGQAFSLWVGWGTGWFRWYANPRCCNGAGCIALSGRVCLWKGHVRRGAAPAWWRGAGLDPGPGWDSGSSRAGCVPHQAQCLELNFKSGPCAWATSDRATEGKSLLVLHVLQILKLPLESDTKIFPTMSPLYLKHQTFVALAGRPPPREPLPRPLCFE